ncbi:MAG: excinuclease ABC subunit UvrC [Bacteroidales bacterium]|nr:excinuclease ABC subunit UvrC [Bacteroidales bacterium]
MAIPNTKYQNHLQEIVKRLPHKPGIYQYFDKNGKIIYVGKAKALKSRVGSYFNKDQQHGAKITFLVRQIADIKVIVVDSEIDALLLENNFIKKYQPRYNILMKDDKTYPWICIKNEAFPRIFSTRNVIKDGSLYFGPYASGRMMHTMLDLIRQLYTIRTCKLNLSEESIKSKGYKVCLEYHIGKCKGACIAKETQSEYQGYIEEIKHLLKGNIHTVKQNLKKQMMFFAAEMEFEKAQEIKVKIDLLDNYQSKSVVVNTSIDDLDVFSIISDEDEAFVNYLKVINGAIVQAHSVEIKKRLDETDEEILAYAIINIRKQLHSNSTELLVPIIPNIELSDTKFLIPQRGDKKKLLELSQRNVKFYRLDILKKRSLIDPDRNNKRILSVMQKDLRMKVPPYHIECFDNSNMQGDHAVAACVVFKNTKPSKKDYRHFNIKTVVGPDDYASMEEVIFRRYSRLIKEKQSLPQLIVIDGGKGQLSAAMKSIVKLGLKGKITVIGIAKRLEEIFFPGDSIPLYLDKTSESLKIIQQTRDEAHRFGITHYRKKHQKSLIKSQLGDIKGIGPSTETKLLKKFKSVKRLKEAGFEEWEKEIGVSKASILREGLKN